MVFSGDIGFYSGADALRKRMGEEYALIPLCGISSPVYFCGKLGLPWQDVHLVSAHGRQAKPVGEAVSYTHLDVYKRQVPGGRLSEHCVDPGQLWGGFYRRPYKN